MRIVEIVGDAHAGRWMDLLVLGLRSRGHEVSVLLPSEGPLAGRLRGAGVDVSVRDFPGRLRNWRQIRLRLAELAGWLQDRCPDVAHMHLFPGALWGRIAAWKAGIPVRATQWPGPLPLEFFLPRQLDRATAWMDTLLIGGCRWVESYYRRSRWTRDKARCVHYPFDVDAFDTSVDGSGVRAELGIGDCSPVVSLIAYLYPPLTMLSALQAPHLRGCGIKGHEVLLRAAPLVLKERPDARFLIVGDRLRPQESSEYSDRLRRMARELGIERQVVFTGLRRDVPAILAVTDVPVVPSLSENLGGAVEPLLMEKPPVAASVGGLPDVVIEGETGMLVPPRDPSALASAILRMAALPESTRREWGRRGRALVLECCSPDRVVDDLESLFARQLSSSRKGP